MDISSMTAYVPEAPRSPTTIFVSLNARYMDPKSLFKIINLTNIAAIAYNYAIALSNFIFRRKR